MGEVDIADEPMELAVAYPVPRVIFDGWSEEKRSAVTREAARAVMLVIERHIAQSTTPDTEA
jgi:hypothetical protein